MLLFVVLVVNYDQFGVTRFYSSHSSVCALDVYTYTNHTSSTTTNLYSYTFNMHTASKVHHVLSILRLTCLSATSSSTHSLLMIVARRMELLRRAISYNAILCVLNYTVSKLGLCKIIYDAFEFCTNVWWDLSGISCSSTIYVTGYKHACSIQYLSITM